MADFKDTGLIMSGDIFMAEVDANGKFGALNGPMNVPSLSITPTSVNRISRPSYQKDNYGQALDAVNLPSDSASVTIQFDSMPASMLAETLGGTAELADAEADSVTGEALTLTEGAWAALPHSSLAAGSVVVTKDATDVTADCDINLSAGLIKARTAAAAGDVSVDYDTEAVTGHRVMGDTEISKPRYILVDGINLATGKRTRVEIFRAVLSADQATELMGSEFITGQLSGSLVVPPGKGAAYTATMYS